VKDAFAAKKIPMQSAEITKVASMQVPLDESGAVPCSKLIDALEDHDDVQKVYSNFSVSDDLLARLTH